ncbi:hypothetical protein NDU88_000141 [Pleurodeles waltl]|uniref:Uncharacterized protein n=1 Tax=Pleurodeles waltl TaxID=8319 RepID=A0AAV7L5J3_PLEWA|nr:hypothetical protein NDU88_000141 [Pleurodeles waltl]
MLLRYPLAPPAGERLLLRSYGRGEVRIDIMLSLPKRLHCQHLKEDMPHGAAKRSALRIAECQGAQRFILPDRRYGSQNARVLSVSSFQIGATDRRMPGCSAFHPSRSALRIAECQGAQRFILPDRRYGSQNARVLSVSSF